MLKIGELTDYENGCVSAFAPYIKALEVAERENTYLRNEIEDLKTRIRDLNDKLDYYKQVYPRSYPGSSFG